LNEGLSLEKAALAAGLNPKGEFARECWGDLDMAKNALAARCAGASEQTDSKAAPSDARASEGLFPKRLDPRAIDAAFARAGRPGLTLDQEREGERFSLPMPPPNITGKLHLGHALDLGLQDALIRRAASRGAQTSWIAGCDHAGQATHEKIMERWPELSWSDARERELYGEHARTYAKEAMAGIMGQFEALAPLTSLDQPRFTLDERYQEATSGALDELIRRRRIKRDGQSLMLDLRPEARELAAAIEGGEILIDPAAHAGRLLSMLREERLWEIGRSFPWGFQADLSFDEEGWATGRGGEAWTLDTWFTSSLWPMAIQGGEPFDALIIGYDIAYFWGARMCMMSKALGAGWPFSRMMLHGLIRDSQGRKFSKSLGNGIDPMEWIEQSGSDALRLWCCSKAAWGMDFKCNPADRAIGGKWLTKMSNACRLLEMRMPAGASGGEPEMKAGGRMISQKASGSSAAMGAGGFGGDWPEGFRERALEFEREFEADFDAFRLDKACLALESFSRSAWCEGWLSSKASTWAQDAQGWLAALRGQKRILALAHPFAPASTWWLSKRLDELMEAFKAR
jgi:valyl-tRNA synthetase